MTNIAESWHRKLNRLISPHPGLHKLIKTLQSTQNETEAEIEISKFKIVTLKMYIHTMHTSTNNLLQYISVT
ncbi:MULE domain-containing protein [Aphis craccivora]|uniref:MULE domain-containing protein n=1 Tax=Aphis craccivora TaxID=307492 RepID=A0A6G0VSA0_APHCR|nr:MULE domain-containing protein [Aphis craccivora]